MRKECPKTRCRIDVLEAILALHGRRINVGDCFESKRKKRKSK
jgi:hypothetical protein